MVKLSKQNIEAYVAEAYKEIKADDHFGRLEKQVKARLRIPRPGTINKLVIPFKTAGEKLNDYYKQYNELSDEIKKRTNWNTIATNLLENDGEKLKLARNLRWEGIFFGIDFDGRALFKDIGSTPILYGFNKDNELLQLYQRIPNEIKSVVKWSNYHEVRTKVLKDGYHLFPYIDGGKYHLPGFSDTMNQTKKDRQGHIVVNGSIWLESGIGYTEVMTAKFIVYSDPYRKEYGVELMSKNSKTRSSNIGVLRLLKV